MFVQIFLKLLHFWAPAPILHRAMNALLSIAPGAARAGPLVEDALRRVERRFTEQLDSGLAPVADLCRHVERYRGKMLRPTLVALSGLASGWADERPLSEPHITVGAVVEMVHMATLVHDDVLDEAATRRGGDTVNRRVGNHSAVILGDYLIARAFHLCSTLESQLTALRVGEVTSVVCEGELLQNHHRGDFGVTEEQYFGIIERKTAALIAVACELGAVHSGADAVVARRFADFGHKIGTAFQIQDDLLDLTGAEAVVGKTVGRDLETGTLTLPVIHHLANAGRDARERTLALLRDPAPIVGPRREAVAATLQSTGSIAYSRGVAASLVAEAKALLASVAPSPARAALIAVADAVVARAF